MDLAQEAVIYLFIYLLVNPLETGAYAQLSVVYQC